MKKFLTLLLFTAALSLRAADTNAPAAAPEKSSLGQIPDASHAPVRVTNTVNIAGERVTYIAETGMLPLLKADGTSRASVFYVAYTRTGACEASGIWPSEDFSGAVAGALVSAARSDSAAVNRQRAAANRQRAAILFIAVMVQLDAG